MLIHSAGGYLTAERKAAYMTDFHENVLTETHETWKACATIIPTLVELNNNTRLQTLFSKFPDSPRPSAQTKSYLWLAYFEKVELKLFRDVLPWLTCVFANTDDSKLYYHYLPGEEIRETEANTRFKLGCLADPDYFRVNHVRINFEHWQHNRHIDFWQQLKTGLLAL